MSRAEQMSRAADERVSTWAELTYEQRALLLAANPVTAFGSGGAVLTINGVDRFFPSRPDALDELAARANP